MHLCVYTWVTYTCVCLHVYEYTSRPARAQLSVWIYTKISGGMSLTGCASVSKYKCHNLWYMTVSGSVCLSTACTHSSLHVHIHFHCVYVHIHSYLLVYGSALWCRVMASGCAHLCLSAHSSEYTCWHSSGVHFYIWGS